MKNPNPVPTSKKVFNNQRRTYEVDPFVWESWKPDESDVKLIVTAPPILAEWNPNATIFTTCLDG